MGVKSIRLARLEEANNRQVFTEILQYRVSVGREKRHFVLYAASYPAEVFINSIRTATPPINRKLFEYTGAEWVMEKR